MKWYENIVDCGDGSSTVTRYKTLEEAQTMADRELDSYSITVDGPYLIDTDSAGFFDVVEDDE